MNPHFHITNLIKELNTLLELLRESLTNLTTKLHAGPDPKKNLYPHSNETEDPKKINLTITQPKQQQTPGVPLITTKPKNLPPKNKIRQYWKPTTNPPKMISLEEGN